MKKKIALFVLLSLLLSTLCLYAAPKPQAKSRQEAVEERIDNLQATITKLRRENKQLTVQYKDAEKALKDLFAVYNELEDTVDELCDGDWYKDISLPASLLRKLDNACKVADNLASY
jgi:septal ring factor EnvC (AmiA/AmiB activator)